MNVPNKLRAAAMLAALVVLCPRGELRGQTAQPRPSRVGEVDESSLVVLRGNRHPLAIAANDRGEVAPDLPMERMLLVLTRDAATGLALQDLLARQQEKSSPDFHGWLSPAQFGGEFGASRGDLQKLTGWLGSHGRPSWRFVALLTL
jgi:trimeric autotransporter adhesin